MTAAVQQLALFAVAEPEPPLPVAQIHGSIKVTWCDDGRTLLYVETARHGPAWLELEPDEQRWLAAHVVNEGAQT
jgi:hypothetical protein